MQAILTASDIGINFGGLKAVDDFNLAIEEGELVGLIGPNGAGKTTVFNMLTGVYEPTVGSISLNGVKLDKVKTHEIVKKGMARTFQNIRLFGNLTVLQNVLIAGNHDMKYGFFAGMFRTLKYWKEEKEMTDKAMDLLRFFDLDIYANQRANSLPYGQQRKLEIARAMATNPKLLLLDEPAAGMNPKETQELMATIAKLRKEFDISILLIEHDMKLVLGLCERLVVLDHGKIIAQGNPEDVVNDKEVIKAYLGEDVAA
ncbi:MAG: ABC transporter ATP-binding protein [Tissierellia bacterium]|nr:ABC transporter ATP-binding protein [Tissierellia bacterium]